jgi:penicillin-binding protein 2
VAGNDITLSIDIEMQKFLYEQLGQTLKDKGGEGASAVVQDPNTGEILALVSTPSYDNNIFSGKLSNESYLALVNHPGHLLLNRPVSSSFPPGSTFKLVVSAAGIETGKINKDTKITDTGFVTLDNITFNNWLWLGAQKTEGDIAMVRAIARSNDTYFYKLGQILGEETIATFAHQFGMGEKTGVQIIGETPGLVPTAEWKEKTFNQVWYPGETLNYAIGQGYLLVSPLQLNRMTMVFANGGKLLQPTILHNGEVLVTRSDFLKPESISVVREGMFQNTVGDGNVSYLFNSFRIKSAGKTGSAESGGENKPHSWYTAYAPWEAPKVAVTVMFERAGHGSEISAPIVKSLFNWYFK